MKKAIPFLIFFFVLMFCVVAQPDNSFELGTTISLVYPCYASNMSRCLSSTECNITVIYPNGSILIDNDAMTYNVAYYNYTISSQNTEGTYAAFIDCVGVYEYGFKTITFDVTKDGLPISEQSDAIRNVGMMLAAGILAFLFLYFAFQIDTTHFLLKLMFVLFFLITIMLIPVMIISGSESYSTLLRIPYWVFSIFGAYFSFYLVYHYLKERFPEVLNKIKGGFKLR